METKTSDDNTAAAVASIAAENDRLRRQVAAAMRREMRLRLTTELSDQRIASRRRLSMATRARQVRRLASRVSGADTRRQLTEIADEVENSGGGQKQQGKYHRDDQDTPGW